MMVTWDALTRYNIRFVQVMLSLCTRELDMFLGSDQAGLPDALERYYLYQEKKSCYKASLAIMGPASSNWLPINGTVRLHDKLYHSVKMPENLGGNAQWLIWWILEGGRDA